MDFFGTAVVQSLDGVLELCASHDGVFAEEQFLICDQVFNRDEFHFCNQITDILVLGHETPGPCGRVFDKRPLEGNPRFAGVTQSVSNT